MCEFVPRERKRERLRSTLRERETNRGPDGPVAVQSGCSFYRCQNVVINLGPTSPGRAINQPQQPLGKTAASPTSSANHVLCKAAKFLFEN